MSDNISKIASHNHIKTLRMFLCLCVPYNLSNSLLIILTNVIGIVLPIFNGLATYSIISIWDHWDLIVMCICERWGFSTIGTHFKCWVLSIILIFVIAEGYQFYVFVSAEICKLNLLVYSKVFYKHPVDLWALRPQLLRWRRISNEIWKLIFVWAFLKKCSKYLNCKRSKWRIINWMILKIKGAFDWKPRLRLSYFYFATKK